MSASTPYVGENGMPRFLSAKERRALAETGGRRRVVRDEPVPPVEALHCTYCHLKKPGRFTWRKYATGDGWSQHRNGCHWACYDCLPFGEGRGEDQR